MTALKQSNLYKACMDRALIGQILGSSTQHPSPAELGSLITGAGADIRFQNSPLETQLLHKQGPITELPRSCIPGNPYYQPSLPRILALLLPVSCSHLPPLQSTLPPWAPFLREGRAEQLQGGPKCKEQSSVAGLIPTGLCWATPASISR